MKKGLKENSIAAVVSLLALVIYGAAVVRNVFAYSFASERTLVMNILFMIPIVIANFVIAKSFADHNKNTMKSLIGFILSGLLMLSAHYAFAYIALSWALWVKIALFVVIAVFTLNQFLLSNDHYSRPGILFINQGLMSLMFIIGIIASVADAVISQSISDTIPLVAFVVMLICTMYIVLNIEVKVNDYKVQREEKGYVFVKSETTEDILDEGDMFISNGLFYALPWIAAAGLVLYVLFNAIFDTANVISRGNSIRYLFFVVKAIFLLVAVITYKSHNKNVMKVMIGFLIGMLLFENIYEITFINFVGIFSGSATISLKYIFTIAMLFFNIFFVLSHLKLTKTHASNTPVIKMMTTVSAIYCVAMIALVIGTQVYYIINNDNNWYFFLMKPIIWMAGTLPVFAGILTIDTRVNGFKIKREEKK